MEQRVYILFAAFLVSLLAAPVSFSRPDHDITLQQPARAMHLHADTVEVIVDNADRARVEITAFWRELPGEAFREAHGPTVLSDEGIGADGVVRFMPVLPEAGTYAVYLYWPALKDEAHALATNAPVDVRHAAGTTAHTIDMRARPAQWNLLGHFSFDPGEKAYVEIRNDAADGIVLADAVCFVRKP